jgi:hypothetical protein
MSTSSPLSLYQQTFLPLLGSESVVYDFGANKGEFSHEIIKRFGSYVFAVEPISDLCRSIGPIAEQDNLEHEVLMCPIPISPMP